MLALVAAAGSAALADERRESGSIVGFECGDNCYLTIRTDAGEELTGLCLAQPCEPWVAEASMPEELVGKAVSVTVGAGVQVDGSGTIMGSFPAFLTVDVAD